jgi:hypothetical protein
MTTEEKTDFSLVLGGPLYQFYLRSRLLRPSMELVHRRILASILITWLPLALLTALTGHLIGGGGVPFLTDVSAMGQFLISLPLLIGAEPMVHRRALIAAEEFLDRGMIAPADLPRFEAAITQARRLRNSVLAEVLLLVIAFTGGYWLWQSLGEMYVATWYAIPVEGTMQFTWAGYWFAFVSLPIGRFLLFRWYYRLFIWYVFLWRMSRLRLRLDSLHPDRAGGLEFLREPTLAFAPVLMAQTVVLAALIGNRILHEGAKLLDFKYEMAGIVVCLILVVLLPLGFFASQMIVAKWEGIREYGGLGSRYAQEFRKKWLEEGQQAFRERLLGSADIQSLADLANGYEVVSGMRSLPFGIELVRSLAFLTILPLLPLLLSMIPLDEVLRRIIELTL